MSNNPNNRAPILLLVPTAIELERFESQDGFDDDTFKVACCGFGPILASASTLQAIAHYRPKRVVLTGIAGTYQRRILDLGQAACFYSVSIYGVGVGTGRGFVSARDIGFPQCPNEGADDVIKLDVPSGAPQADLLLTCCAGSASAVDVQERMQRFSAAVAEDMEGFGVAMACRTAGLTLTVVRGISNCAGERDQELWRIDEAVEAAWKIVKEILHQERDD